jgi:hypothetical protein
MGLPAGAGLIEIGVAIQQRPPWSGGKTLDPADLAALLALVELQRKQLREQTEAYAGHIETLTDMQASVASLVMVDCTGRDLVERLGDMNVARARDGVVTASSDGPTKRTVTPPRQGFAVKLEYYPFAPFNTAEKPPTCVVSPRSQIRYPNGPAVIGQTCSACASSVGLQHMDDCVFKDGGQPYTAVNADGSAMTSHYALGAPTQPLVGPPDFTHATQFVRRREPEVGRAMGRVLSVAPERPGYTGGHYRVEWEDGVVGGYAGASLVMVDCTGRDLVEPA